MSKSQRQKKLQLLKGLAKSQSQSEKLIQEQSINLVQTKLLEKQLVDMKAYLESLEQRRDIVQQKYDTLQSEASKINDD